MNSVIARKFTPYVRESLPNCIGVRGRVATLDGSGCGGRAKVEVEGEEEVEEEEVMEPGCGSVGEDMHERSDVLSAFSSSRCHTLPTSRSSCVCSMVFSECAVRERKRKGTKVSEGRKWWEPTFELGS